MVSATTGASLPLSINSFIRDGNDSSAITSLVASGNRFYGSGYTYSRTTGTLEGAFKADWNGDLEWMEDCHGDTYSVFPTSSAVYVAGHPHYCGNVGGFPQTNPWTFQRGLAFSPDTRGTISREPLGYTNFEGKPRPDLLHFFPYMNAGTYTGQNQGPWSVTGTDDYVSYAGEFTTVNGTAQQGIVRFARKAIAPKADAPTPLSPLVPHVRALAGGKASISWPAVADRDDPVLDYRLVRDGVSAGIYSTTARSSWWRKPYMTYIDSGLVPGQTYTYQVRAADPTNARFGPRVSFTYNPGQTLGSYDAAVLADGPKYFYPLDDASVGTVVDVGNGLNGTGTSGTTTGVPGAIAGQSGTAFRFNASTVGTPTLEQSTNWFSVEAWFKTTSTRGGKIIGFGNSKTGSSATYDRHVYLTNDGRVYFGVNPAAIRTVNSVAGFNNGQWHHVVATLGNDGQKLYVDGQLAGSSATNFAGRNYEGYWRIGGDALSGWPNNPLDSNLAGDIDQVAIYPTTLAASRITAHYTTGKSGQLPNQAPTASFTATTSNLTVSANGTQSSDPDGTIAGYAWTFGDGATATGATTSHAYATAGTYTVKLVVTDDDGTSSVAATRTVTVQTANQAPTASFTLSSNGLTVAANGSASSDPDGTITGYAWDFGDDSNGSGATPTHTYAAAGTYVVKLTVTDNQGGTATRSQAVTVPTGVAPFGLDEFNRSVSGGWGSADVGGAWTVSSAGAFSVSGGSGRMLLATAGAQRSANLTGASADSADVSMVTALDKPGTGGGTYVTVSGRRIDAVNDYRLTIKALSTNRVTVAVGALKGSATVVQFGNTITLPGNYTAGDPINVRFQVTGTNPTTVRARVWLAGQPEPSGWTVSATDSYAELQKAGHFGITGYLSGSATNAPVTVEIRRLEITAVP